MGEAMRQKISAIFSIILLDWTDLLKLDEHRYTNDPDSGRKDTGSFQVTERAAEFSEVGEWALFWGRSGIRKPELQKLSLLSLPRHLPSLRERLPSLPRPVPSLPGPQLFRPLAGVKFQVKA